MADQTDAPRLTALVFTDVVKSVDLKSRLGDVAAAALLGRHNAIVKSALEATTGGRVLQDTGDGFLIRFNTATDAVNFALRLQYALAREPWQDTPLQARVGIHLGDVWEIDSLETGFHKLTGLTVDMTARIMSMGEGGQILVTRAVFDSARQNVRRHPRCDPVAPPPLRWMSHGSYLLNGISDSTEVFEVGAEGVARLHAPADSQKARRISVSDGIPGAPGKNSPRRSRRYAAIVMTVIVLIAAAGGWFARRQLFARRAPVSTAATVPATQPAPEPTTVPKPTSGPVVGSTTTQIATAALTPTTVPAAPPAPGPTPLDEHPLTHHPLVNTLGMKFVRIHPGEFLMGSPLGEEGHEPGERLHKVKITKPFFMGMHHVTRGQFAAFVGDTNYKTDAEKDGGALVYQDPEFKKTPGASWRNPHFEQADNHPVVAVTWNDAMAFIKWLNKKEPARHYRLPTEAEWEYASRAGTQTAYFWGDSPKAGEGYANCADMATREKFPTGPAFGWRDGFVYTSPVGFFKPNPWGLHDMIGNAWVWCSDFHAPYDGDATDPTGPQSAEGERFRVTRGGAWPFGPRRCRAASRGWCAPAQPRNTIGFRVCMDP